MKKCEICHGPIDVHKGGYINEYPTAWEMHTYHINCYNSRHPNKDKGSKSTIKLDEFMEVSSYETF